MRSPLYRIVDGFAWVTALGGTVTLVSVLFGVSSPSVLLAGQGMGLTHLIPLCVVAVWALWRQHRLLVVVAVLTAAGWGWRVAHDVQRAVGSTRCGATSITVSATNFHVDNEDAGDAVTRLVAFDVDIAVGVETNPSARQAFTAGSWTKVAGGVDSQGENVTIWVTDAVRVVDTGLVDLPGWSLPYATVAMPAGRGLTVVGVHLKSPVGRAATHLWGRQLSELASWVDRFDGSLILAGDFNASIHHRQMHPLLDRLGDSARSHRHWAAATWPTATPFTLLDLDHMLFDRSLATCSHQHVDLPGSDHLGVVARIGYDGSEP